jgi:hypothetical protein
MTAGGSELVQRDESQDDYDLLTYAEVAARLSEEMVAESRRIADLEQSGSALSAVREARDRLALLEASKARYEQQAKTAEVFMRRFGLTPRRADSANQ